MGEARSSAELTVEDIENQLNDDERLQLVSRSQAPKFVQGLKSCEAKVNEGFRYTVQGKSVLVHFFLEAKSSIPHNYITLLFLYRV